MCGFSNPTFICACANHTHNCLQVSILCREESSVSSGLSAQYRELNGLAYMSCEVGNDGAIVNFSTLATMFSLTGDVTTGVSFERKSR